MMFKTPKEVMQYIKKENIVNVDLKCCDLFGRWRHLTTPSRYVTVQVLEEGFGFDGSSYGFKQVEKSDMLLIPDLTTAFRDPFWLQPTLSFICNIHSSEGEEERFEQDPRFVCDKAESILKKSGLGDTLLLGPEFEFYLFDKVRFDDQMPAAFYEITSSQAHWSTGDEFGGNNGYSMSLKGGYHGEQPADRHASFRSTLVEALHGMGIGVKYHHHEVGGPGQVEIETEFDTARRMADKTLQIKYATRNFAVENGLTATFMPKPMLGAPGSGLHVHFKLFKGKTPVFADSKGYAGMSETAMRFMTGILVHSPAISAFANPSTNSFKRLVPGYEAPVSIVLAMANRSAAIRIPGYAKTPSDKRFEYRAGDATANPYLMFAALIMAGMDGVKRKLDPKKEGVGPIDVNLFDLPEKDRKKIRSLPRNLLEALDAMRSDHGFLTAGGVFPQSLIDSWIKRKTEEEAMPVMLRPHPYEFTLSYAC